MVRQIADIISDLKIFCMEGDYMLRLSKLTDELLQAKNKEEALPALFGILEKYPEEELGSPGPLVHAIEKCKGYEKALIYSLDRRPSTLGIWMLYRLLKKRSDSEYKEALRKIKINPLSSEQMKEDAELIAEWLKIN
ncbi:hypothetical protein [Criblamydia sequanensis]|uniref:Uncharacterized protein n=1 Tax=Candidatus Criblamydia sequanensis CRIB-18 TaxID=1437425 RepID=A0A090E0G5_9BACT|nr:hypothetical protein [Criblamydia sequanensis]CDR34304.1 Conserved hypothetical protein [Criblamydia sequanensis CRIB-18]